MQINRGTLLAKLNETIIGVSTKEMLEQSNNFVFTGGKIITFNDDIMCRADSPLDFDVVVNATEFMELISKLPDDEITVMLAEGEILVKGKNKKYGLVASTEVTLPYNVVPSPEKWHKLGEGVMGVLQQAGRVCGNDDGKFLSTCVHVTPDRVESCDNLRMFRQNGPTGFPGEVLIPAHSILELDKTEMSRVSICKGWLYFRTTGGTEIACRCYHAEYPDVGALLEMDGAEKVTLPANLGEMIERAEIFNPADQEAMIGVKISENEMTITSRKESGWCKERKSIEYTGRALDFEISPKFLVEVLKKTRDVVVDERKMSLAGQSFSFVVCLRAKAEEK